MNKKWYFDTKNMDHYILLFLILALFFYVSIFILKFDGLTSPDQMYSAQISRNLYNGNGFVTNAIDPISLTFYNSLENHPDFLRPPLFPILVATSFRIFGINDASTYESTKTHLPFVNYVYFSTYYKEQYFKDDIINNYINNPEFNKDFEILNEFDSRAVLFRKKGI